MYEAMGIRQETLLHLLFGFNEMTILCVTSIKEFQINSI